MPIINKHHDDTLHNQLINYFRAHIHDGSLPPGAKLPTELELADEYNISRGTVRQAMTVLAKEGLVERIQGRGTFVRGIPAPVRPSVAQSSKGRIGLLLSYPASELDLDILRGVEHAAKSRGYQVSFAYTEESADQQTRDIDRLRADGVAGLIIYPLSDLGHDEAISRLQADQIPYVLIDRYFPDLDCDYIVSDNFAGGYRATEHLIILGHTRIGFLYSSIGTFKTTSVRDRFEGYRQALAEYGLPLEDDLIYQRLETAKSDPLPYLEFLRRPDRPGAIFASRDNEAILIMKAAQHLGIRIPDELGLIGFDNLRFTVHTSPPLTTVSQPCWDMGARAVDVIIQRIEGLRSSTQHIELPTNLIVRESCGAKLRIRTATKE